MAKLIIRRVTSLKEVRKNKHLVEAFFAESAYAAHELAWGRIENLAKVAFEQPDRMMILAAEKEGEIVGFAMCGIGAVMGVVGLKTCQVQVLTIVSDYRRTVTGGKALIGLLRAITQWSQKQGAFEIGVSFGEDVVNKRFRRMLAKLGFEVSGVLFKRYDQSNDE